MDKVFVVFGSTGSYSDATEWLVRAFATEADAITIRDRCNAYAADIPGFWDNDGVDRETYLAMNPDDPHMIAYTGGVQYGINEVPFGIPPA